MPSKKFYEVLFWWLDQNGKLHGRPIYVYVRGVDSELDAKRAAVHIAFAKHPEINALHVPACSLTDRRSVRGAVKIHAAISKQILDCYKVTPAVDEDAEWDDPDRMDWYYRPKTKLKTPKANRMSREEILKVIGKEAPL